MPGSGDKSPDAVEGYSGNIVFEKLLTDWASNPIVTTVVTSKSRILETMYLSTKTQLFIIGALFLVFTIILSFSLLSWISKPLKIISFSLNVGSPLLLKELQNDGSEFGNIARLIINFFEQKHQFSNEIKERKRIEALLAETKSVLKSHIKDNNNADDSH